jgi:tetratricopeptide (TPR) repeat protein
MLASDLPESQRTLVVAPQDLEVILAEDGDRPLALILPPTEDLDVIEGIRDANISVTDIAVADAEGRVIAFREELAAALEKLDRFSGSPTFLNRLANLAAAAGDLEGEATYIALARAKTSEPFYAHRQADNLLSRGRSADAERLLGQLDLTNDLYGNLKLAVLHIQRRELGAAADRVARALDVDPTDFAARLFDGGLKLLAGQYDRAINSFRIAAEDRPASAAVYSNMAIAYIRLQQYGQAFAALKRAVALGPLNVSAVFLLADLAFERHRDEDAIPSLKYLLRFEQKLAPGWARLARAFFQIRSLDDAITALRHEASGRESSSVWNNLGVCYALRSDPTRALQSFKRAMELGKDGRGRDYFLAAKNMTQAFAARGEHALVLHLTTSLLAEDTTNLCRKDDQVSDIYALHLTALLKLGRDDQMMALSEDILSNRECSTRLISWTLANVIAYEALHDPDPGRALGRIAVWQEWVERLPFDAVSGKVNLYNNIAFALAEAGRLAEAEYYLKAIASHIHHEPYPTATLGLVTMRRGNVERGTRRYREAISLARMPHDKARIRQKLNLELGRHFAATNPGKARRYLENASRMSGAEDMLVKQATSMLRTLPRS